MVATPHLSLNSTSQGWYARLLRMSRQSPPRSALATSVLLVAVTACSAEAPTAQSEPPSYDSTGVAARALPQVAATGADTLAADKAEWVVEAVVEGAGRGAAVRLVALVDGEWTEVDADETDENGQAALTTTATGDLHVVSGTGADAIGTVVATEDTPAPTFTDDFDDTAVDEEGSVWTTRYQEYGGVRTCSIPAPEAAEVTDGVLRLSVLDHPDRGKCTYKRQRHDYRLNGHVGTQNIESFTYGFAAARMRFPAARGQHGAFWLQPDAGQQPLGPEEGGAEIDVIEYFGDDHPEGGLTSFTYWLDEKGRQQTKGGWIPDPDRFGSDWSEQFHVFSVEWTPEEYVFRIDGQVTHRLAGPTSGQPEFLILSLLSSDYELKDADAGLPQHMDVDWVRVWETPR